MAALDTTAKVVTEARTLLQDTVVPYRYSDADLLLALNFGLMTARRIRPDLFLSVSFTLPNYTAADSTTFAIDEQYRMTFVYFIVGHAQLRDDEDNQDGRAAGFLGKFTAQLLSVSG
jgi:hypothetical protein